ncbi:MAG TPA: chemotaxis protein CheW [Ramlibacter sp.]|jgi:two-component system chemotaxis sensor kinase CheA|uniref:chemotaxis protein CheA n=1 Tax=Ramlibacter sp. TaxID=1917967 RepID=UPI002D342E4D|nr:chemotaxis protein CheW [Ramlibacter sp.]HZY19175.1 chemotaxis protein CheW [Ramlibacter sp.]
MSAVASNADFDLTQFYQVFFEEAGDNLDNFEQLLLGLDVAAPAEETLHAIFRCAHSVKGGAATFGFADVAALTHAMETLLDRLRRHEQLPTTAMVDTLLEAGDQLRALLACHQAGGGQAPDTSALLQALQAHAQGGEAPAPTPAPAPVAAPAAAPAVATSAPAGLFEAGLRDLELLAGPLHAPSVADDLIELFGEVTGGGSLARAEALPGQAADVQRFRLKTSATDAEVLDLCSFHLERDRLRIAPWPQAGAAAPAAVAAAPVAEPVAPAPAPAAAAAPARPAAAAAADGAPAGKRPPVPVETLRVSLDKVDQLINLMGELVITQAMLAQRASGLDGEARQQLVGGLSDLERTTRDLQESVMSIRMIPMGEVFNRFPRMLRELAARLGKQLELRTVGEATELDKGLIEKITDPLTHLVRNAVDHGIELPQERLAKGKPPHGTLTMSARHEGGCIVIEVRDDGRGLDRERLLAKARKNGMQLPETMTDSEVYGLIFAPGFSTAEAVTDISGRGVGMDVVRRNILRLGGTVELDSTLGQGTCVRVRLPLTLAIMDGMSVAVAGELYLLPLASVVESFQAQPGALRTIANGQRVVKVRDDWLPVVSLARAMNAPVERNHDGTAMLVLVQAEGRSVALEVAQLVGQQQVVVKNLEANYRRVPGVSGATIMGDGSVALILDVSHLVRGAIDGGSSPAASGRQQGMAADVLPAAIPTSLTA